MGIKCFMLEETDRARRWLRRYGRGDCPLAQGRGYHDAFAAGDDSPVLRSLGCVSVTQFSAGDARWPKTCACGYVFGDGDAKQTFFVVLYKTPDGKDVTIHTSPLPGVEKAPPGAMWYADWFSWKGPDGRSLCVMLPDGGAWLVDGPASNSGEPWVRAGAPPVVTAHPSIQTGSYHGWLRNGELVEA